MGNYLAIEKKLQIIIIGQQSSGKVQKKNKLIPKEHFIPQFCSESPSKPKFNSSKKLLLLFNYY
jgi:hypothetical protein